MMVSAISNLELKKEFLVFLRNQNVLSTSTRGVTTTTETFDGDNSTVTFNFSSSGVKNVRSVTVDAVSQTNYTDYDVDYFAGTITFTSAPASGTDNISISLDYGNDSIFDDWPRDDLNINSFPRVSFDIISKASSEQGLSGDLTVSRMIISVTAFSSNKKELETMIDNIRTAVLTNKTSFNYFNFITADNEGPIIENSLSRNKILQKNIDFVAPVQIEV